MIPQMFLITFSSSGLRKDKRGDMKWRCQQKSHPYQGLTPGLSIILKTGKTYNYSLMFSENRRNLEQWWWRCRVDGWGGWNRSPEDFIPALHPGQACLLLLLSWLSTKLGSSETSVSTTNNGLHITLPHKLALDLFCMWGSTYILCTWTGTKIATSNLIKSKFGKGNIVYIIHIFGMWYEMYNWCTTRLNVRPSIILCAYCINDTTVSRWAIANICRINSCNWTWKSSYMNSCLKKGTHCGLINHVYVWVSSF